MRLRLALLLVMAASSPLAAQDQKKASPLPSHLPLRTEACFGRVYDAKHLASHPKQRVTSFHLSREFKGDPYSEDEPSPEDEMKDVDGEYGNTLVTAYVRFRDRKGVYMNGLTCRKNDSGAVFCGVDCDGGTFNLKPSDASLLLENNGFVVVGGCSASEDDRENEEHVRPGADDKVFRLDPKPFAACMAERGAMAPVWAKLGTPLRTRFGDNDTLCFSRSYDAAHLAAHPKQEVKRIAVLKTKESLKEPGAQFYELAFRVEMRNGKTFEGRTDCAPDRYAYGCQPKVPMDADRYFYLTRAGNNDVMLRDKHALLEKLFNAKFGADDRVFRLKTEAAEACRF
jgi:hypothetical protein